MPTPNRATASSRASHRTSQAASAKKNQRKWVNEPPKTAAEAQQRIDQLTVGERQKIRAYLMHGSFLAAAETLDCDPDTISKLWKRVSACFGILIKDVEDMPGSTVSMISTRN